MRRMFWWLNVHGNRTLTGAARQGSAAALFLIAALMTGCGETPTLDPPKVRWGQDVCAACGMILSEPRFAAAIVLIHDQERQVSIYDDVSEMLDAYEPSSDPMQAWVVDAATQQWIKAATAHYLHSPTLHTPMGRGVAAFADSTAAKQVQADYPGELLTFADLTTTASELPGTSEKSPTLGSSEIPETPQPAPHP